ncbi:MAG: hypothetical protein NWF14_09830 [Candidatus Bathyarchaeota archaeon]|nr:hypothetical protein [Candidatus Bathyarchaeota archaeon]
MKIVKVLLVILLIASTGLSLLLQYQESRPSTIVLDGVTWTQVLHWDFKDGSYPEGQGWENWTIIDGNLQLEADASGLESVYLLPAQHGEDFLLETKVKMVRKFHPHYVAVQLVTRDSEQVNHESGFLILPEIDQAIVRHMVNKVDYVYTAVPFNMSIEYDVWHLMRFMVHKGVVRAFVDSNLIYDSNASYPVGGYREPHLSVRYGIARFEYVKIFETP